MSTSTLDPNPPPLARAPRAILLDLDDTLWPLVPTMKAAEQALAEWLQTHSPTTAASFDATTRARLRAETLAEHPSRAHDLSFIRQEMLRRALEAAGDDPALAPQAFQIFIDARRRVTPYPEVEQVLAAWSRRYTIVAVSNGNADVMRTPLGRFFKDAVNAERIGVPKPEPAIFMSACALAQVEPHEALHIGDDPALDLIGALHAGLQGAWLLRDEHAHRHAPEDFAAWHPTPYRDLLAIDQVLTELR